MSRLIDITRPLGEDTPLWPGSRPFAVHEDARMQSGAACNVSGLTLDLHAGTHLDAAWHLSEDGARCETIALDALCGMAQVLDCRGYEEVTEETLAASAFRGDIPRILLLTDNSFRVSIPGEPFRTDYVALSSDGAKWLLRRGVRLVGIDGPSIEAFRSDALEVHKRLLGAQAVVLENLDLSAAEPGLYELFALPLKLYGLDAAPLRAILRGPISF